jgi:CRP-like cAMP-binding protein
MTYAGGDEIFTPGPEPGGGGCGAVHRILSGHVRLYKALPDGRAINLALLGPGECFTQSVAEHGQAADYNAQALSPATIERSERSAFLERAAGSPELALALLESQSRQLAALRALVEHLLARDAGVRLATALLALADGFGATRPDGRVALTLPLTHQALADMIGSNRVTVTRKLRELRAAQAVFSGGRHNLSIDPPALRAVVEGG